MATFYVLYNPLCGIGEGEEDARLLEVALPPTTQFFDMTKITNYAALLGGFDRDGKVIVAGGDGTLHRFINDTDGLHIPQELLYFPIGTGNDFAREWGNGPYADPFPVTELLKNLPTVTVDGREYTYKKVWIAPTMWGKYYGGGMMPAPQQDRGNPDGTLSVMVLHGAGRLRTLCALPGIFKGTHVRHTDMVTIHTGHEICVEFDRPAPLQIDGETMRNITSYTARCRRR